VAASAAAGASVAGSANWPKAAKLTNKIGRDAFLRIMAETSAKSGADAHQTVAVELTNLELAALDLYRSSASMALRLSRPQAARQLLALALKAQARWAAKEGGIPVDQLNATNDA
jgi:hypothetical protein